MNLLINYKRLKLMKTLSIIFFVIAIYCSYWKLNCILLKIKFYNIASSNYNSKKLIDAEQYYQKAHGIKNFDVHDEEIEQRLKELGYITNIEKHLIALNKVIKNFDRKNELKNLYKKNIEYLNYVSKIKSKDNTYIVDSLIRKYKIEKNFDTYFLHQKNIIEQNIKIKISKNDFENEGFKNYIYCIPAKFYGGYKNKYYTIQNAINNYDNNKIKYYAQNSDMQDLLSIITKDIEWNKKHKNPWNWLLIKAEYYGLNFVQDAANNNDYDQIKSYKETYSKFAKRYGIKSKVLPAISNKIFSDLVLASNHIKNNEFKKAIDIYNKISSIESMDSRIEYANVRWAEVEPMHIFKEELDAESDEFNGSKVYNNVFGSLKSILTFRNGDNYLYLGQIIDRDNFPFLRYSKVKPFAGDESPEGYFIDNYLNGSQYPTIIVYGKSDSRKQTFVGYEVGNQGKFKEVFRIEADGIESYSYGILKVDNPVGQGSGGICYYSKSGGYYTYQENNSEEEQTDYIQDVSLDDTTSISNYDSSTTLRFDCYISDKNAGQNSSIGMYKEGTTYYYDKGVCLRGDYYFTQGEHTIEGTYAGSESIYIPEADQYEDVPVINVTSVD